MKPHQKAEVISQLEYLCSNPKEVYEHLTEDEREAIAKKGYVTKDAWKAINRRLKSPKKPASKDVQEGLF